MNKKYKKAADLFKEITKNKSFYKAFDDVITMMACSIQNVYNTGTEFERIEKMYKDISNEYTDQEMDVVANIWNEFINIWARNPFQDLLGDFYMQLNMGAGNLGQYFTPFSISDAAAMITINIDSVKKAIEKKGYYIINEPTVGSGGNVVACCKNLALNDIDYQKQVIFICQDISQVTALMCYTTLSLLGCSAVIKIGDLLEDPYTNFWQEKVKGSKLWITPMFYINNCCNKV